VADLAQDRQEVGALKVVVEDLVVEVPRADGS
jgi:hypothetical protein